MTTSTPWISSVRAPAIAASNMACKAGDGVWWTISRVGISAEPNLRICDAGRVSFHPPPASACWAHRTARSGFEVAYFEAIPDGLRIEGTTAAIEDAVAWVVTYRIHLDAAWAARSARITARTATGWRETFLESAGAGHWLVDGNAAPHLDGCLDVDLESSAMTNAVPVHRMNLRVGEAADAPAAYVRALGLTAERLEQVYVRIADQGARQRYEYTAPAFGFTSRLSYDDSGLVVDYPGIAVRAG